jgi:hypothetical protein
MATQPTMPKAVSSLQSVQRLYISDSEAEREKEEKGNGEVQGVQGVLG